MDHILDCLPHQVDQLRMEQVDHILDCLPHQVDHILDCLPHQVDAREKLLRDDLVAGRLLPPVSEPFKNAEALARLCGESAVPAWLREMGAEPRNAASSSFG